MGQQFGPVSPSELRRLAIAGKISHDTLVRKGDQGNWVRAQRVRGLFEQPERERKPPETHSPAIAKQTRPARPIIPAAQVVADARPAPTAGVSMPEIRQQYWWLFVPLISWIGLVFPLILPPIPLGPIMISLAWNRREWMPHITRSLRALGKERKTPGFPLGWIVNVFVNLGDMVTLGLSHLFITASLHDQLAKKTGTGGSDGDFSAAAWVAKWLLLGNVAFVLAYIACPGLCFGRILLSMEERLRKLESEAAKQDASADAAPTPVGRGSASAASPVADGQVVTPAQDPIALQQVQGMREEPMLAQLVEEAEAGSASPPARSAPRPGRVALEVLYPGQFFVLDMEIRVSLDGRLIGMGSAISGIHLTADTTPGAHTLELDLGFRKKRYKLTLEKPGVYEARLKYSRFWGNFANPLNLRFSGA